MLMQILKCRNSTPTFLFLRNLLILGHITCAVCKSVLVSRSLGLFNRNKFCAISDHIFSLVSSLDGNFYICTTCGKKLNKNCIPCLDVCCMLEVCELPKEFRGKRRLERELAARRLLFKKIISCEKVSLQSLKVHYVIYQQI